MYPGEARLRNLTYCAPLFVDVKEEVLKVTEDEQVQSARVARSRLCDGAWVGYEARARG